MYDIKTNGIMATLPVSLNTRFKHSLNLETVISFQDTFYETQAEKLMKMKRFISEQHVGVRTCVEMQMNVNFYFQ